MKSWLLLCPALLASCVTVTKVNGPDGEQASLIRCPSSESCLQKATEVCPEGYVIRTTGTNVSGFMGPNGGQVSSSKEMLISCKSDLAPAPAGALTGGESPTTNLQTCQAASRLADEFGAYWARTRPTAKLLDTRPDPADFVATCSAMPPNVQRCMHARYRAANARPCDAALQRLDPPTRAKIDALFFEESRTPPASPGTTI